MTKYLKDWEQKTIALGEYFIERYFGKSKDVEHYWIADDVGGVLVVNDYFFSLNDIVEFIKYSYPKDIMFNYYDYALEYHSNEKHKKGDYLINIENYKKLK